MNRPVERQDRIDDIFHEALHQPADSRASWLAEQCAGDEELHRDVSSLLAAHQAAGRFLETPAMESRKSTGPGSTVEGREIDRYRLVRLIATGGMGSVWLAERSDAQFEKQVALKLIRPGFGTDEILQRFRQERQVLARLEHPNIARLLDGGITDDGLPYLVMEYVEGRSIARYCDEERLTIDDRIDLFRIVCNAVHYAHQNLIVHRDLKPGNILVTNDGEPKLLDFGIAKILDNPDVTRNASPEETILSAMTPMYASPEQIRRRPITTGSDLYSLGVILYELLSGGRPYPTKDLATYEIERIVCEHEPKPLHAPISSNDPQEVADSRSETPARLARILRSDLETIVSKAMNKEPDRRYGSVLELSEDLRRYQTGLPVVARRDTFPYRAVKFVLRNRLSMTAAAVVIATILLTLCAMNEAAHRERAAREESDRHLLMNVEQLVALKEEINAGDRVRGLLTSSLGIMEETQPDALSVEALLGVVLQQLENGRTESPRNEAAVRMLIGTMFSAIGRYDEAEKHLNRAMDIRLALSGSKDHPELAKVIHELGFVYTAQGKHKMAKYTHICALDMRKRLIGDVEDSDIAASLVFLSEALSAGEDYEEAEKTARQALGMYFSVLSKNDSSTLRARYHLAVALIGLKRYDEAMDHLKMALEGLRHIFGSDHARIHQIREKIGEIERLKATLPHSGEQGSRRAVDEISHKLDDDSRNPMPAGTDE